MAVLLTRTRVRPNTDVDWNADESNETFDSFVEFETEMLNQNILVSKSSTPMDENGLIQKMSLVFTDAKSAAIFYQSSKKNIGWLQASIDNLKHCEENNITESIEWDWDYNS